MQQTSNFTPGRLYNLFQKIDLPESRAYFSVEIHKLH